MKKHIFLLIVLFPICAEAKVCRCYDFECACNWASSPNSIFLDNGTGYSDPTLESCLPADICHTMCSGPYSYVSDDASCTEEIAPVKKPCVAEYLLNEESSLTVLHQFKNAILEKSMLGRFIVEKYYSFSGPIIKIMSKNPKLKSATTTLLDFTVRAIRNVQ